MLTIGLTGGIGSGKSTAAKMLAELGAPSLDADRVGHAIYAPGGPAYQDVVAAFGKEILAPDGAVDRKKLGPIVFGDPAQLKRLNAILHPKMLAEMRAMVAAMRARGETKPIVVEAAILVEANWMPMFDEIWLVTAARERVLERVERERGMAREQAEARIRAQLSDAQRIPYASLVIKNDGTVEELRAEVERAWRAALARNL
ncbi:MAG TPA: dephospho-CoA kinase [Candidatus Binataceae bacterium]|nr:dephospho-CoA kinase [Candidatus Binataceae bacterium]